MGTDEGIASPAPDVPQADRVPSAFDRAELADLFGPILRPAGRFGRWLRTPEVAFRFLAALLLAAGYVALVNAYTQGALLYGTDFVGVYSPDGFFLNPSANYLVPAFAAGVTFGNVYAGQALGFFLDVFLTSFACMSFARELFRGNFGGRWLVAVQTTAGALLLINPYVLTWGLISITTGVFLSEAAFLVVMLETVRFARGVLQGGRFRRLDAAILGVAIGLSAPVSFPNVVRVLGVEAIGFALTLGVLAYLTWDRGALAELVAPLRTAVVWAVPAALVLLAYPAYTFATVWFAQPGTLSSVEGTFSATLSTPSYNTLSNIVRLVARRQTFRFGYYATYATPGPIGIVAYVWPVLAIVAPAVIALFTARLPARKAILGLEAALVVAIIWGTGAHPPFAPLNAVVTDAYPLATTILPSNFLEALLETKLYAVLTSFTLGTIAVTVFRSFATPAATSVAVPEPSPALPGRARLPSRVRRFVLGSATTARPSQWLGVAAAGGLVVLLVAASWPLWDGEAEVDSIGQFVPGFRIPAAYFSVRSILQGQAANAVLLPAVSPYIQTTWGYSGATLFYLSFNYPSKVVVPAFYGAYQIYLPGTQALYANATQPVVPPSGPANPSSPASGARLLTSGALSGYPVFTYRTNTTINASGGGWLRLHLKMSDFPSAQALFAGGSVWVGLRSHNGSNPALIGWYVVGASYNTELRYDNATDADLYLLVGQPSSGGAYDPTNITGLSLWIHRAGAAVGVTPVVPGWFALAGGSVLSPSWPGQMAYYGVRYLLVDQTIVHGATQPMPYVNLTLATLRSAGALRTVYVSPELQLYEIV